VIPDPAGRLKVIAVAGSSNGTGRMRSDRRRSVFRTGRHISLPIRARPGFSLGIFPLDSGEGVLGVVEIVAPTTLIEERTDVLLALVGQSALVLRSARVQGEAQRALAGMNALVRLASELVWAKTQTEIVRMAVSACHMHLGGPVAGLLPDRDGWGWFLAGSAGLGDRRRSSLRRVIRDAPTHPRTRRLPIPSLRRRFREVTNCRDVLILRAGPAVFLIADAPAGHADFLNGVASVLREVLPRFRRPGVRASAGAATEVGIAWTAHELKGPLASARAAIDVVTETAPAPEAIELLRRTNDELGRLSDLIDPLLRWSAGAQSVELERVDLVYVTRQAVATSALASEGDRVSIDAPGPVFVRADPRHLRSAISNVVRNSLAYAPPGTPIKVQVRSERQMARIVIQDRGPGIPAEERRGLFEPFRRGTSGRGRPGWGLGLFIARRVLEAHGGSIAVRPAKVGATFVLELPAESPVAAADTGNPDHQPDVI
jgi:signal transduction histidine kinase